MNALITDYPGLRAAIKARRMELGLSQLAVDHLSGCQTGYQGKLEIGLKQFGDMSLGAVLGALGIVLELRPAKPGELAGLSATSRDLLKKKRAELGARGGRATGRALTEKQRKERARKAGLASGISRQKRARLAKVASRERERQGKRDVPPTATGA